MNIDVSPSSSHGLARKKEQFNSRVRNPEQNVILYSNSTAGPNKNIKHT